MHEQIPCVWEVEPRLRIYEAIPHKVDTAINNSQAVVDFIARYASDLASECILVFNLDTRGNLINFSRVTTGTLGMAPISGREMFKTAILSNAASIIMAHNHPSGDPTPSLQDVNTTEKIIQCGKILDIPLLDHIIVGSGGSSYSFLAMNDDLFDGGASQ